MAPARVQSAVVVQPGLVPAAAVAPAHGQPAISAFAAQANGGSSIDVPGVDADADMVEKDDEDDLSEDGVTESEHQRGVVEDNEDVPVRTAFVVALDYYFG